MKQMDNNRFTGIIDKLYHNETSQISKIFREAYGILNVEYEMIARSVKHDDGTVDNDWVLWFSIPYIREYINTDIGYTFDNAKPITHQALLNEFKAAVLTQYRKIRDINFIPTPIFIQEVKL